jgi:hypothetical protein
LYIRCSADVEKHAEFTTKLSSLQAKGFVIDFEVKPITELQDNAAKDAASSASSSDTLVKAIHSFVEKMPLDSVEYNSFFATPDREEILRIVMDKVKTCV